jgi:hypothetical protein
MRTKTDLKAKFITDEKGKKSSVVIDLKDYKNLLDYIEDLEDAYDLLKAEKEAADFIPYDLFRKRLLTGKKS